MSASTQQDVYLATERPEINITTPYQADSGYEEEIIQLESVETMSARREVNEGKRGKSLLASDNTLDLCMQLLAPLEKRCIIFSVGAMSSLFSLDLLQAKKSASKEVQKTAWVIASQGMYDVDQLPFGSEKNTFFKMLLIPIYHGNVLYQKVQAAGHWTLLAYLPKHDKTRVYHFNALGTATPNSDVVKQVKTVVKKAIEYKFIPEGIILEHMNEKLTSQTDGKTCGYRAVQFAKMLLDWSCFSDELPPNDYIKRMSRMEEVESTAKYMLALVKNIVEQDKQVQKRIKNSKLYSTAHSSLATPTQYWATKRSEVELYDWTLREEYINRSDHLPEERQLNYSSVQEAEKRLSYAYSMLHTSYISRYEEDMSEKFSNLCKRILLYKHEIAGAGVLKYTRSLFEQYVSFSLRADRARREVGYYVFKTKTTNVAGYSTSGVYTNSEKKQIFGVESIQDLSDVAREVLQYSDGEFLSEMDVTALALGGNFITTILLRGFRNGMELNNVGTLPSVPDTDKFDEIKKTLPTILFEKEDKIFPLFEGRDLSQVQPFILRAHHALIPELEKRDYKQKQITDALVAWEDFPKTLEELDNRLSSVPKLSFPHLFSTETRVPTQEDINQDYYYQNSYFRRSPHILNWPLSYTKDSYFELRVLLALMKSNWYCRNDLHADSSSLHTLQKEVLVIKANSESTFAHVLISEELQEEEKTVIKLLLNTISVPSLAHVEWKPSRKSLTQLTNKFVRIFETMDIEDLQYLLKLVITF